MGGDAVTFSNISATTSQFELKGGVYAMAVVATFGGGTVKLQQLGPDGSTWVDIKQSFYTGSAVADDVTSSFSANGQKTVVVPPGMFRVAVAMASGVHVSIAKVPGE